MKILILRFSSIGDIVLTTPVIRVIKTSLPDCELHFATKKEYSFILSENPYLNKTHLLENSLLQLAILLRREKFDLIIDLHHNLRTSFIKSICGAKSTTVNKLNWKKWLLTNFKINTLPNKHIVDRYIDCLKPLHLKMDNLGLDYFIPEKDEVELSWLPEEFQNGYVALVIGAKKSTKRLPNNRLIELCDRINQPVVLLGGKDDELNGEEIASFFKTNKDTRDEFFEGLKALNKKTIVFNAAGKFNFNQSASLIKQASWVFTHDTGLMHVAAAFKKEIYSIWGSTIPEFGMYPYRTKFVIFENKKIHCRPCSKIGYNQCPKGHFKCMNEVQFDFYLP